jgi:hypothetical protein
MQIKLLTLALFASFFATGFTAPIYPGLTEAESETIRPVVQKLGLTNPTKKQVGCIAKVVKDDMGLPLDGTPLPSRGLNRFLFRYSILYQECLQDPNGFQ